MKLEICSFSGYKIYPGKGKTYVRIDSRYVPMTFRFINGKAESYFLQKLNPRKIKWTVIYRRLNKKGITEEIAKKRTRRTVKHDRAVVGASWDAIRAKRSQKPEARAAARQAAIAKSKEAKKAAQAAKKAAAPQGAAKISKQQAKGFAPKAAATSR
ncbi:60S ribosomal protein L24 [Apophysomyces ossiformis]|uniref:60S ribosomal protein L24 n=1 Tax=Apophysomyces ossiformis TaxID=679940 RepID=A0A8H7C0L5_9FUNG|nr:60S ribosomal protein L24 [Apophysomyces ossiformis]